MRRNQNQAAFVRTNVVFCLQFWRKLISIYISNLQAEGIFFLPYLAALGIWLVVMIATPIGIWVGGEKLFPLFASLGVIAQSSVTFLALLSRWNIRRLLMLFGVIFMFTWAVEWIGSTSGFPFGNYHYTDALHPQFSGVPVLIPMAWWMMLAPSWAISAAVVNTKRGVGLFWVKVAVLSGLALTAWDLYLDPQMVAKGLWVWIQPGVYFGIPVSNFFGWLLTATILTMLIRPKDLPIHRLTLVYTLVWLLQAVGQGLFWGQPGPAIVGFVGMGIFVVPYWYCQYTDQLPEMSYSSPSGERQ
jgi:putative membrane protein